MARRALRDTGPAPASRCACGGGCPRCAARVGPHPEAHIDAVLNGAGRPLDAATAVELGSRFNQDFGGVRVHDDVKASASTRALRARAWTSGEHIAFAEGQYRPGTHAGRQLIAHELAHVLQDRQAPAERRLARFTMDGCEETDHEKIRAADARATAMAKKALGLLRQYRTDYPDGTHDVRVSQLLVDSFGFEGTGGFLNVVIDAFEKIHDQFVADDYQYECEDDCDDENAYVYGLWSDIHLCMNKLGSKARTVMAGVMLHEMSHYTASTDDEEYFYSGTPTTTTLHPTDAIANADGYESFAEEAYKRF